MQGWWSVECEMARVSKVAKIRYLRYIESRLFNINTVIVIMN